MFLFLFSVVACVHHCQECVVRDNINNYLKRCDVYHISRKLHQEAFLVVIIHSIERSALQYQRDIHTYIHTLFIMDLIFATHSVDNLLTLFIVYIHISLLS